MTLGRLDLEFNQLSFKDFVAQLSKRHDIDIELDAQSFAAAGINPGLPVSMWVKGITLKSALELTLPELGLVCVAEGDKLLIRAEKGT